MTSPNNFKSQKTEKRESKLSSKYFTKIIGQGMLIVGLIGLMFAGTTFGGNTPSQHTDNNKDNILKGGGRVNPSTLAMEIDIPLANYPGRGINVPISLSYSSKLWRFEMTGQEELVRGESCFSTYDAVFSERSASGWTSSLDVPRIEFSGWEDIYDLKGFPIGDELCYNFTANDGDPTGNKVEIIKRIMVHLPSGGSHELRMDDTKHRFDRGVIFSDLSRDGTFYAVDGSNIKFVKSGSAGKLYMPDGSFYNFTETIATKFTDRNGNSTIYNSTTNTWTDTLGRTLSAPFRPVVPTEPTVEGHPQEYKIPGYNGGEIVYKLHWKKLNGGTQAESALTDINDQRNYALKYAGDVEGEFGNFTYRTEPTLFSSGSVNSTNGRIVDNSTEPFNPVVLTKIELPTGQNYEFFYDIYGRIEKIKYPTGGTEDFTYNQVPGLTKTLAGDIHKQANHGVTQRTLSESINNSSYTWDYSASYVYPQGFKVKIINPDRTEIHRYLHRGSDPHPNANQGSYGYDDGLAGMAYKTASFDSNGNPVSQTLTHWDKTTFMVNGVAEADWHPRVTHTENYVYDPNDASQYVWSTTKFEYEKEADLNQIDTPLLKKKTLQYPFESSSSGATSGPTPAPETTPEPMPTPIPVPVPSNVLRTSEVTYLINDPSVTNAEDYIDKNMVGLVTESLIKDNSGDIVSKSVIKYDEPNYSPPGNVRGNPTTSRVWDSTQGLVTDNTAYIETHAKFDTYGNQIESIDALGRTTITGYDPVYKAFPVKVTSPIPDDPSQNPDGLEHGSQTEFVTETTYDITAANKKFSGLPNTTIDANGVETKFTYDAATLRPINVKRFHQNDQIGSTVETIYDDVNRNITNKAQIDMNNWTEHISYYDGLGRTFKSEQVHSDGNIFVEKEFYNDGKVKRVSNPYRTGETKLWTTNIYDDAGRTIEVILQDGAKIRTDYAVSTTGIIGTTKQITDQAGKKRKGINDVLGRMIRVIEDPDGQALETDYKFDTLGNLRETIQGGQHRYFMHDSLGRLLYSKQPEEDANTDFIATDSITGNTDWSNKYEYDEGGNITSTTNARGVSVTAHYDNFNRIILRDYSDDTPDVSFFYDGYGLDIAANNVPGARLGKTTKVTSSVSETRYTSFDNLGRLLKHEQRTTAGQLAGSEDPYETAYTYNLSGAVLTETYPSGRVMNYDYRADGELDKLTGTREGSTAIKTYLNNISYNTLGNIEKMKLGNGTWESAKYNDRQQISQIALGSFENDNSLLKIDYEYGTVTENNGSLRQQKINYNGLNHEIVQNYTYDDLNRLKSAQETTANNPTNPTWKQTFDYDRFGNREFDAANTDTLAQGVASKITNPNIETSNNRMTKDQDGDSIIDYDYDKSGNVTLDAENQRFIYDAENRIKEFFKTGNGTQSPDASYQYDGDGKRVRKLVEVVNGTTETIFVYNASGQLVAEYSNDLPDNPKISYLTEDHLGSPRIIIDNDKDVVSRHDYLAFGDEVTTTVGNVAGRTNGHGYGEDDDIRKQYTGYERDKESGLDYAQARYYNSNHGRFTSVDPLTASADVKNPQTFNRYSYVLNSPYKFVDPLGLVSVNTTACGACGNEEFYLSGDSFSGNDGDFAGLLSSIGNNKPQQQQETPPPPVLVLEFGHGFYVYNAETTSDGTQVDVKLDLSDTYLLSDKQKKILARLWYNNFPQMFNNEVDKIKNDKFGEDEVVGKEKDTGESKKGGLEVDISKDGGVKGVGEINKSSNNKEIFEVNSGTKERKTRFVDMATANKRAIIALQTTDIDFNGKNVSVKRKMNFEEAKGLVNLLNSKGKTKARKLAIASTEGL